MPPGAARQFVVGEAPAIHGETLGVGEGPTIVLCHGLTATRGSVIHGSRALERAGHRIVLYDARGHGESAPAEEGYGYPRLVTDLEAVVDAEAGEGPIVLGGHSMGAHTAIAFALRHPRRLTGLVAIGPTYNGPADEEALAYWDGLADALESEGVDGFVARIDRVQGTDQAWRDSVLRFTQERMLRHRHLGAVAQALREVPRSAPFEDLDALAELEVPTLVVASHDAADPGHPYAIAREYAERLPQARLISEPAGQSPLAWQGGRLSREIAQFAADLA
jgi:pimeloyl-ACP methyl ester carboxylesterase